MFPPSVFPNKILIIRLSLGYQNEHASYFFKESFLKLISKIFSKANLYESEAKQKGLSISDDNPY